MTALPSIRNRLSWMLAVTAAFWILLVCSVILMTVRDEVNELQDDALQEAAEVLYGVLSSHADHIPQNGDFLPAPPHHENFIWQVVGPTQQVLMRSHEAPTASLLRTPTLGHSKVGGDWHVYGMRFGKAGEMLYVGQRGSIRQEAGLDATYTPIISALLAGLACVALLSALIRRELRPLKALSDQVKTYDPAQQDTHFPPAQRSELAPIHGAIRELAGRLNRRLGRERVFSAQVAHALRTPLAGMSAQLAAAQQECPPDAQASLQRARDAADQLRRVVSSVLTLFRADGQVNWQRVDVAELVAQLPFERLSVSVDAPELSDADPDLLAAAIMHLLDNAERHGASMVTVTARQKLGGLWMRVHDDGQGIPEVEIQRLQTALDAQDYAGEVGLGLMLADMVVRAHEGRLRLRVVPSGCAVELQLGSAPGEQNGQAELPSDWPDTQPSVLG